MHPCVFNLHNDELAGLLLGDLVEFLVGKINFPLGPSFGADNIVGGVVDRFVVYCHSCWRMNELGAVVGNVVSPIGDEADKAVDSILLVVWDVEKEREEDLVEGV